MVMVKVNNVSKRNVSNMLAAAPSNHSKLAFEDAEVERLAAQHFLRNE